MGETSLKWAVAGLILGTCTWSMAQVSFTDGQAVEVREGDTWSAAKVLTKEGRRYKIRYEGGADEEWVPADRLRAAGGAGKAASSAPAPASPSPSASPWTVGQEIESKRALVWRTGKVAKLENGWVLVHYEPGNYKEWVEPWRIRVRGSKEDAIGKARMNPDVKGDEGAPKDPPSQGPEANSGALSGAWNVGQDVQCKWGGTWWDAVIEKKEGDWLFVHYSDNTREWVEPWRIRKKGSNYECGYASPNHFDRPPTTPPSAAPGAKGNATAGDEDLPGFRKANMSGARKLTLAMAPNAKVALSPAPAVVAKPGTLNSTAGEPSPRQIVTSRGATPMAAVLCRAGRDKADALIDRINIVEGKPLPPVTIEHSKDWTLGGVSGDGGTLLMRKSGGSSGSRNEIELWQVDAGGKATRTLAFQPYDGGDVEYAALIDDKQILTLGGKSQMVLWDATTAKAIWTCDANEGCDPALSPDGKHLAFVSGKDAIIIEIASGNVVAELPREMGQCKALAFSPGGKQLMGIDQTNIRVADLATGEMYREVGMPGAVRNESIASPAEGWALINGGTLVDIEKRIPVWNYTLPGDSSRTIAPWGQLLSAVDVSGRACMLVPSVLPTPEAVKAAQGVDVDDVLLLKPGTKISLQISVGLSEDERKKVMAHLNSEAQRNGFVFADGQPVQLVLSQEQGQTQTRQYQRGGNFGPFAQPTNVETVSFSLKTTRMKIAFEGKTAWEVSAVSGDPGFVLSMKSGQSAQDAASTYMGAYNGIFWQTPLPGYLVKPRDPIYLGSSEISSRGVK